MKKYIALLLCVALLLSVTACGKESEKPQDTDTTTTTTTAQSTTTEGGTTTTTTVGGDTTSATDADGTTTDDVTTTTTGGSSSGTTTTKKPTATDGTTTQTTTGKPTSGTASTTKKPSTTTTTTTTTTKKPTTTTKPVNVMPTLPAVGTDIDVANPKGRLVVSAAEVKKNADGSFEVTLTFKNTTKNWITEETDWVEYTCYDAAGAKVQGGTKIHIGCIDTKAHPVKTFSFTVPAGTAEVRLTNSKIIYWTEWS